jgi:hypothetical protein
MVCVTWVPGWVHGSHVNWHVRSDRRDGRESCVQR